MSSFFKRDHFSITAPASIDLTRYARFHRYESGVPEYVVRIYDDAPKRVRLLVELMAVYFKREFRYDFLQYSATDPAGAEAFIFLSPEWGSVWSIDPSNDALIKKYRAVGACCFRFIEWENAPASWEMQWIWLHPFCRRMGMLSGVWPTFVELFGDFRLMEPLSESMKAFIEKVKVAQP